MDPTLATALGIAAGAISTIPLAVGLVWASAPGRKGGVAVGIACVIASFVLAQGALAVAYVRAPGQLAHFGIPCAAAFLAAATVEGLVAWRHAR